MGTDNAKKDNTAVYLMPLKEYVQSRILIPLPKSIKVACNLMKISVGATSCGCTKGR
jgi:hypothetical protein